MSKKRTSKGWISTLYKNTHSTLSKLWQRYKGLYRGKPVYVKAGIGFGSFVVCFFLYLLAVNFNFLWLFGKSPSIHEIMNPKTNNASYIYSADGQLIGKYFNENRTPVKFGEVSPHFYQALIDTEDERFYEHWGIDFQGLFAAVKDMIVHRKGRGASTITQQLVKNMFRVRTQYSTGLLGYIPGVKIVIMKTKEWILATEIEIVYHDKQRILEMYANTVDFGNQAYGIKTAARTYFNTSPDSLTIEQSALLVGMLKGTTVYNPRRNPKNALKRRNVVLSNMMEHGHLTRAQFEELSQLPITLDFSPESPDNGMAPYFRQAVVDELAEWTKENGIDLYTDGLEIHTTLDTRMQRYAEQAVHEEMKTIQERFDRAWGTNDCWVDDQNQVIPGFAENVARKSDTYKRLELRFPDQPDSIRYYMNKKRKMTLFTWGEPKEVEMSPMDSVKRMLHYMHAGFIAMDPQTGGVKAYVGNIDYRTWKFDCVANTHQPGSTFKLFVYAAAMEQGYTPCDRRKDQWFDTLLYDFNKKEHVHWHPTNANGRFSGANVTFRQAFAQSINSVAVRVGLDVGLANVAQTARDMGIKSNLADPFSKKEEPALTLGAMDVNLVELVNAFSTVARDGRYIEPMLVTVIYRRLPDGSKELVYQSEKVKEAARQAITHRTAYLMQKMLEAGRTDAGGTSMPINNYIPADVDLGGKTGTSNRHADAWFVAVTPGLVAGAWVGGEYRQIHFLSGAQGQGNKTALPIVGNFLRRVFADPNFASLRRRFPVDAELDRTAMLCSNEALYDEPDTTDISSANDSVSIIDAVNNDIYQTDEHLKSATDPQVTNAAPSDPKLDPDEKVRRAFGNSDPNRRSDPARRNERPRNSSGTKPSNQPTQN